MRRARSRFRNQGRRARFASRLPLAIIFRAFGALFALLKQLVILPAYCEAAVGPVASCKIYSDAAARLDTGWGGTYTPSLAPEVRGA